MNGATNSTLSLTNLQATDAGGYDAVVTNKFGSITSVVALLTVNLAEVEEFDPQANYDVYSFALQADGKIVVGGAFTNLGGESRSCIGRLNADGTVDTGFNPGANDGVYALALQPDGRILVGGNFTNIGRQDRSRIARLNTDGTLDTSFNAEANSSISCLAVQPDGRILVGGGFTSLSGQSCERIGRLNPDGTVDASFNAGANDWVNSLAVQPDGKILVGGYFTSVGGLTRNRIARLNTDGTVDTGFNPGANGGSVNSLTLQPDGRILAGGTFTSLAGQARSRIGRLNPDGTLDTSFDPGANSTVSCMVVQTDGNILVGGSFTTLGGQRRNYIGQLNPDGSVDSHFTPQANGSVYSLALQADGKVLAGGNFTTLGGKSRSRIGRLINPGPAGETLASDGATVLWLREGSSPEVWRTLFDLTTNGTDWTSLDEGMRIPGGWQLTNMPLPPGGTLRARGQVSGGRDNASSWFVEMTTIIGAPAILTHPLSATNYVGTTASFGVVALGAEPLHYRWRKNGTNLADGGNISGAASPDLSLSGVQLSDAGNYSVVLSNDFGIVTSFDATLTVLPAIPASLSAQPIGFDQLRFTITGTPGGAFHLQGSPDLFHWAIWGTHTNQSGTLVLTNPLPLGRVPYFYRAKAVSAIAPPAMPAPILGDPTLLPDGAFCFELNSVAGSAWRLEGSPDAFHWGNYGVLTNQTGTMQITNAAVANPTAYFYRLVQP